MVETDQKRITLQEPDFDNYETKDANFC